MAYLFFQCMLSACIFILAALSSPFCTSSLGKHFYRWLCCPPAAYVVEFPRFSTPLPPEESPWKSGRKPLSMFTAMYVRDLNSPRCVRSPHVFVAIRTAKSKRAFARERWGKVGTGRKSGKCLEVGSGRGELETLPPSLMFALLCLTHNRALTARADFPYTACVCVCLFGCVSWALANIFCIGKESRAKARKHGKWSNSVWQSL